MRFVGLKGDLQYSVSQTGSIEASYCHCGLIIVCHSHKSKTFAFIGVKVTDDLHVGDSSKGPNICHRILSSASGARLYTKIHHPVPGCPGILIPAKLVMPSMVIGENLLKQNGKHTQTDRHTETDTHAHRQ